MWHVDVVRGMRHLPIPVVGGGVEWQLVVVGDLFDDFGAAIDALHQVGQWPAVDRVDVGKL